MNNLELLHDLNRRHARLEVALFGLKDDLQILNMRLNRDEAGAAVPPPVPLFMPPVLEQTVPPPLPDFLTTASAILVFAPLPEIPESSSAPAPEPEPEAAPVDGAGLELQFGRWLARIGVVFALFTLVFFSVLVHDTLYKHLGPWAS